jgi:hypothetical protein
MTTDLNELLRDVVVPGYGTARHDEYAASVMAASHRDEMGYCTNIAYRQGGEWKRSTTPTWNWLGTQFAIIPPPPVIEPYTRQDKNKIRGRWCRSKVTNTEYLISTLETGPDDWVNGWTPEEFATNFEWIDLATGAVTGPCGNEVKQ